MNETKTIALLGSTGSIGTQTLDIVSQYPHLFSVSVLVANSNADMLIQQAIQHKPSTVIIKDEEKYPYVKNLLQSHNIEVHTGINPIIDAVQQDNIDVVVSAIVGYDGMLPTLKAIEKGKTIALANKEALVVGGELLTQKAKTSNATILPVDSEHSAIFQCILGETQKSIEKIILTASGGTFLGKTKEELQHVTRDDALKHPTWNMGAKITIDSATLMNKGLEVIEAKWLFNLSPQNIDVVVHPQSIVHSMVQFNDGAIKAHLGMPDMRMPIIYALNYPNRITTNFPRLNLSNPFSLDFQPPDRNIFKCLNLAYESLDKGGNMPCVLNAANEVAVSAFLKNNISFGDIPKIIELCMANATHISLATYEDYVITNQETRKKALEIIKKRHKR